MVVSEVILHRARDRSGYPTGAIGSQPRLAGYGAERIACRKMGGADCTEE